MSDNAHPEIVIIRRGGHGDHDEHHGGVWKIAFADFMTAMMAFFLVMWLISANDKTRASVARYFNPVKLVDATTQPRGLHDPKADESGMTASANRKENTEKPDKEKPDKANNAASAGSGKPETAAGREQRLDKTLAENPYAALAEIAATKGAGDATPQAKDPSRAPVVGLRGGEQFRDPFAPPSASPPDASDPADDLASPPAPAPALAMPASVTRSERAQAQAHAEAQRADKQQADTKARIVASLKAGAPAGAGPAIDVRRTAEGLLVSLTDTTDFAMFTSGSAVPSKRVVLMMEHVAQVLKARHGTIIVRGYTDNKPYHSTRYDNWRLSLDRAQVTHYMLVRGGLADARIGHIEGYADRDARTAGDPASPNNRRIEILLKDDAS